MLDPKKNGSYWGFGIIAAHEGNTAQAIELFEKGYKFDPKDARFVCDYGMALGAHGIAIQNTEEKDKAKEYLAASQAKYEEAMKLSPELALPYSRMAILDFFRADYKSAWKYLDSSRKLGGEGLDPRFIDELSKTSPRP